MPAKRLQTKLPSPLRDRRIGIVWLTLFLDLVGFSIIFPLFPAMLEYYLSGAEGSWLAGWVEQLNAFAGGGDSDRPTFMTAVLFGGILGSLYSLLQFAAAPLWGALSDRIGRRPVLLLTVAGIALSYLIWFFASAFWLLVLARILGGLMAGNLSVATAAVADITRREQRTQGLALVGIAFGLGFIVGPAIGGLSALIDLTTIAPALASWGVNPFSVPALISFVLALVNLWWIYSHFEESLPKAKKDATAPGLVPETTHGGPRLALKLFSHPLPQVRRVNAVYLLFMLAFSGMEFTLTFLAVERLAFSTVQNGLMFVFIGLILVIVQGGIVRRVSGRISEVKLAAFGMGCGFMAFVLLSQAQSKPLFFLGLACMASAVALASPTLSALVSLYSDERDQGRSLGLFRSAGSLARAFGPIIAAFLFFRFGSATAYSACALFLLIPLLLTMRLPRPRKSDC
jgi:MFS family permease